MDKYKQFILDILINRGRFAIPDGEYKERHHIIPKCMGGSDDEENLVYLYAREHIVAHKILTEIYPDHSGVWDAFWQMCNCDKYDDFVTPKEYELARIKHSENMSERWKGENNPMNRFPEKNPMKRPEVVKKMVESLPKKPVEAIDPETGCRVRHFESIRGAGRAGFDPSNVCKCCNGKPGYKTHKGYIWKFIEEVSDNDSDN